MKTDTQKSLRSIFEFLDVENYEYPTGRFQNVYNKSPDINLDNDLRGYLQTECRRIVTDVATIVGEIPSSWRSMS